MSLPTPALMLKLLSKAALVLLALVGSSGCDGLLLPAAARSVDEGGLTILRVATDAPPLEATEVSFWMVRGEAREVEIRYLATNGYNGKCLRLVIPAEAPLRDANGRTIEPGDSIRVTVRVVDSSLFLFEILPEGVLLNPTHPAQLEIRYRWMSADANGDGIIDAADVSLAAGFQLWTQSAVGAKWSSVPGARRTSGQEIQAPIAVFGRYALASD